MKALKASAVGSSCSKVTTLPTQDGGGHFSPLLQLTSFQWEVTQFTIFLLRSDQARAAGLQPLLTAPPLSCSQTRLQVALTVPLSLPSLAASRHSFREDRCQP